MTKRASLADLTEWRRDNYGAFVRGEIDREEYERIRKELVSQELAIHESNKKRAATKAARRGW